MGLPYPASDTFGRDRGMSEGESDALGDAPPPAGGTAGDGHAAAAEKGGLRPLAPQLALPAEGGGMGDEAVPEQLDWGSIDDEDGAFGQLAEASNIEDADPAFTGAQVTTEEQISAGGAFGGPAGGTAAISTAPLPETGGHIDDPSATLVGVGSNEDANPGHPGAQKTTGEQHAAQGEREGAAAITAAPRPEAAAATGIHTSLREAAGRPRASADGPVAAGPDNAVHKTPVLESVRGTTSGSAVDAAYDGGISTAANTINAAPATHSGTRNLGKDKNLSNKILMNAVKAFSPLKLRLGGSLQDMLIYDTGDSHQPCTPFVKNTSAMFGFSQGCLPLRRWDELNAFFQKTGPKVSFGLNALNGRVPMPDGSLGGPWNYTNAASFIRYTVNKGYDIHGWELGNELSGSGVGARIDADQYAADVITLKHIIDSTYQSNPSKPLVIAPGGFFDAAWFTELISKTKPNQMDAITHHIYNLGPGVDDHLVQKILDPSYLDGEASTFSNLQGILKSAGTSTVAWVGEAGGAYNSGHHLVTDAFVFSFWYLDQLGMSAKYDTKTYCRQTLVGGNYGLLNTTTFEPNPDYYSALLWHRLMGTKVLSTKFNGTNKIRAYAHCAKKSEGITLLLINLDGNNTNRIYITSQGAQIQSARKESRMSDHIPGLGEAAELTRQEYHLTPKDGNLQSQQMLLNGIVLATDANGDIPKLEPVQVEGTQPITVGPYSIVFAHIPSFYAPACS